MEVRFTMLASKHALHRLRNIANRDNHVVHDFALEINFYATFPLPAIKQSAFYELEYL